MIYNEKGTFVPLFQFNFRQAGIFMKNALKSKWGDIITRVKDECNVTDVAFRTWIEPLTIHSIKNNVVTILINEEKQGHSVDLISNRYMVPLRVAIEEITGEQMDINFLLSGEISSATTDDTDNLFREYPFLNSGHSFDNFVVFTTLLFSESNFHPLSLLNSSSTNSNPSGK